MKSRQFPNTIQNIIFEIIKSKKNKNKKQREREEDNRKKKEGGVGKQINPQKCFLFFLLLLWKCVVDRQ